MGKLYSALMCHIIRLFKLTPPDTYSSDEFLFEEFNVSKEDRRRASENLHSLWLIDLQHKAKVSVPTSDTETQMQQVIKEAWGCLHQCNPSCSCRCYFFQRWPKQCSSGCKKTHVVICTPCWNLVEGAAGVALSLLCGSQRVKTSFAKLGPCLWWSCPGHSCSSGHPAGIQPSMELCWVSREMAERFHSDGRMLTGGSPIAVRSELHASEQPSAWLLARTRPASSWPAGLLTQGASVPARAHPCKAAPCLACNGMYSHNEVASVDIPFFSCRFSLFSVLFCMHRAISISFLTNTTGQMLLGTLVRVSTAICSSSKDGNVIFQTRKSWLVSPHHHSASPRAQHCLSVLVPCSTDKQRAWSRIQHSGISARLVCPT